MGGRWGCGWALGAGNTGGWALGFGTAWGWEGILHLLGVGVLHCVGEIAAICTCTWVGVIGVCVPRLHDGLLQVYDTGVIEPFICGFECLL